MKFFAFATALFLSASIFSRAQTNADAAAKPAGRGEMQALSILTPDQQTEYAKAHAKALADNPSLKAEGDTLMGEYAAVMAQGTPADKQAIMEMVSSHRQKLRKAMLKADPNLGPIFAQIDKSMSELKAKGAVSPAR